MKIIEIIPVVIENKERFGLHFSYDSELIRLMRSIPGAAWSKDKRCWHIARTQANFNRILRDFAGIAAIGSDQVKQSIHSSMGTSYKLVGPLSPGDEAKMIQFSRYMQFKRYSPSTQKTYLQILGTFLRFRDPDKEEGLLKEEVIRFTNEYILPRKLSNSYQNQFISETSILRT
jgi:integrase/recombinase XerD